MSHIREEDSDSSFKHPMWQKVLIKFVEKNIPQEEIMPTQILGGYGLEVHVNATHTSVRFITVKKALLKEIVYLNHNLKEVASENRITFPQ